jgi:hypothetical protein
MKLSYLYTIQSPWLMQAQAMHYSHGHGRYGLSAVACISRNGSSCGSKTCSFCCGRNAWGIIGSCVRTTLSPCLHPQQEASQPASCLRHGCLSCRATLRMLAETCG